MCKVVFCFCWPDIWVFPNNSQNQSTVWVWTKCSPATKQKYQYFYGNKSSQQHPGSTIQTEDNVWVFVDSLLWLTAITPDSSQYKLAVLMFTGGHLGRTWCFQRVKTMAGQRTQAYSVQKLNRSFCCMLSRGKSTQAFFKWIKNIETYFFVHITNLRLWQERHLLVSHWYFGETTDILSRSQASYSSQAKKVFGRR